MKKSILIILVTILIIYNSEAQKKSLAFKNWGLKIEGNSNTYQITTPSTLSENLISLKLIPQNPYYRDNFLQFYKYQTKKINYTTYFNPPIYPAPANTSCVITFQGLDTHCKVYLNGKQILDAHNMFRKFVVPVDCAGLVLNNTLLVSFQSSAVYDMQRQKEFYDQYGFKLPQNYSFSRKAAYQYGWDWGPRILTVGIWKQAYFEMNRCVLLENPVIDLLTPITSKKMSRIDFKVKSKFRRFLAKEGFSQLNVNVTLSKENQTILIDSSTINFNDKDVIIYEKMYSLTQGMVANISKYVWWTWDLGQPNLFSLTINVWPPSMPQFLQSKTIRSGFRTVKVKQIKDSIGTSFTLSLNGYNVFMRGGNYIPPEMSMSNIKKQQYLKIKQYSLFGKYNMIRVWGGGQFENDLFYQTMDEAGILIWHDLMFACAMYPVTYGEMQLENIKAEMEDNLWRVGHHPSIGLWNGNNQVWIGWQEWGWQNNLDLEQKYLAENMYSKIFRQVLPITIYGITPDIFYWQTSPSSSSNQVSTIGSGDIHFWRVWGGGTPIEEYQKFIGRFNSEYGMQSMPEYSSILKFTNASDRVIDSLVLRLHERHPYGDKYLPMYTEKYGGKTTNLKRYAYFTQVMQAYAIQMAISSLRGNKPFCMGSLYWQLNDVWPVSSWSTVDYYGMYKISHYRVRQLHNQLLLHLAHIPATNTSSQIYKVYASNEYDRKISLFTQIRILDFNGTVLQNQTIEKSVNPFQNLVMLRLNVPTINKNRSFVNIHAINPETEEVFQNNYFFVPPADRVVIDPQLQVRNIGNNITISAKNLANYVWIRAKDETQGINLQRNYFDILPGQTITLTNITAPSALQISCYQCEQLKDARQMQPVDLIE